MSTRQTFANEMSKRARSIGWAVTFNKDGQVIITNPDTGRFVQIHNTPSDRNAFKNVVDKLGEIGFADAEEEWLKLKEEDRKDRLKVIREKNQAELDKAQKEADMLARASGQSRVSLEQLVTPYPIPKTFERVLVTPEMASALLDLNTANRPVRQKEVQLWVKTIESNNWHYTHQGAAIDSLGVLQDGQHRLSAILVSGISCEMQISVGMPPENFSAIDNGLRRTFGDVVSRAGFGNRNRVGTAARLVLIYDDYPRRLLTSKVSNSEVHSFITSKFDDESMNGDVLARAANKAQIMWRATRVNASASTAGIYKLYDLIGEDDSRVQDFVEGVIEGNELAANDPRQKLRKFFLDPNHNNRTAWYHLGIFIKAWNKFITGQTVEQLSFRKTEDLPAFQVPIDEDEPEAAETE